MKILLAHEVGERFPHVAGGAGAAGPRTARQTDSDSDRNPGARGRPRPGLPGRRAGLPRAGLPRAPPAPPRAAAAAAAAVRAAQGALGSQFSPFSPQHVPPAAAPLLRHLRGAAARRARGPRGIREELGPAGR